MDMNSLSYSKEQIVDITSIVGEDLPDLKTLNSIEMIRETLASQAGVSEGTFHKIEKIKATADESLIKTPLSRLSRYCRKLYRGILWL